MPDVQVQSSTMLDPYNLWTHLSFLATSPTILTAIALCITLLLTRILSNKGATVKTLDQNGTQTVPAVPYWIPLVGHIPNMAWDADGFVRHLRYAFPNGIFALNFGGTRHNVLYTPGLATALLNQKTENAASEDVSKAIVDRVFGFPKKDLKTKYDRGIGGVMGCYKYVLTEPSLGNMVATTAAKIRDNITNLVTGSESPVDEMVWEKTSSARKTTDKRGEAVVEASLLPLIRDFAAHNANPSIMGSDFLANFPNFFEDLWILDRGFLLLAAGLPRWLPIPTLTRAHIARRRLLDSLMTFHEAMENEWNGTNTDAKWSSLDDVGALIKARMEQYRKHGWSIRARAATEHALMWAANANSNPLMFWMINHIYADRALLEMIREEIAQFVGAVEPDQKFAFAEPARFDRFDVEGLCSSCPLLKSCYIECLRLDTASWSLKIIKQDFVLQSREKGAQGWLLRKGDYAHAAHDLHNTDPSVFADPMIFRADRHVKQEGDEKGRTADMGSIRPYGESCWSLVQGGLLMSG